MPMVITDLRGRILAQEPLPFCKTPAELVETVRTAFSQVLRSASIPRIRVQGVGITVSGIVDAVEGVCRYSAALNWGDVPVAQLIGKGLRLPAWVDNDANAIAMGEKFFGRARDCQDFSSIVLGRTIGAAHYMHEMLYRGHDGSAGEIGHITMDPKERCAGADAKAAWTLWQAAQPCARRPRRQVSRSTCIRDLEALAVQGNPTASGSCARQAMHWARLRRWFS